MSCEEMGIAIEAMNAENGHLFNVIPSRFSIVGILRAVPEGRCFSWSVEEVALPHAVKTYPDDPYEPHGRHAVFFARLGGRCVGQVYIQEHWNGMARIEDIRVDEGFRKRGAGRLLMDAAVAWAGGQGFSAICLETQDINAGACRFYAAYGFALKGVDMGIYENTLSRGETALYWYLPLVR